MTTFEFDEDGFLTERRPLLEAGIRQASEPLFARAHQINRDCHRLLFSASPHEEDGREVLVLVTFIRALEHYQAALLLLNGGLIAPAKVAIRAALEAVFAARAIARHDEALKAFITDDLLQRRKLIRKAQQYKHTNLEELRGALTAEFLQNLDAQIAAAGAKSLSTERLAQLAGMHDWYTTAYALLSKTTHSQARDLDCYLLLDETEKIRSLEYAPSLEQVPELLLTVAHCILLGGDAVAHVFAISFEPKAAHVEFIDAQFKLLPHKTPGPTRA